MSFARSLSLCLTLFLEWSAHVLYNDIHVHTVVLNGMHAVCSGIHVVPVSRVPFTHGAAVKTCATMLITDGTVAFTCGTVPFTPGTVVLARGRRQKRSDNYSSFSIFSCTIS